MRFLKVFFILFITLSMLNGCLFKKKKSSDSALYGTDTPLVDFPLDSFYSPIGEESAIFRDIHFNYNSYEINAEERSIIEPIISWMQENNASHLLIEGHCDERGSNEYNLALGEQRALAVRQYIIDSGVHSGKVQTISYGEELPADPGHDEGAWRANRRARFLISNG